MCHNQTVSERPFKRFVPSAIEGATGLDARASLSDLSPDGGRSFGF